MSLLLICAILFVLGAVQDWGSTAYINAVNDKKAWKAAFISIVFTLGVTYTGAATFTAFMNGQMAEILAYSFGGGLGSFCAVKFKKT